MQIWMLELHYKARDCQGQSHCRGTSTSHTFPFPSPPLHSCPKNKVIYILISCQTWSDQASSGWLVGKNWEAPTERSGEEQNKLTEFHLDLSSCLNIKYEKFNSFLLFWLTLYFSGGFCMFFFDKDNFDILNRNCCQRTEPTRVGLI